MPDYAGPGTGGQQRIAQAQTGQQGQQGQMQPNGQQGGQQQSGNGLPVPLGSPAANITEKDLRRILADPYISDGVKQNLLTMIQQRAQPQTIDTMGDKLQFNPRDTTKSEFSRRSNILQARLVIFRTRYMSFTILSRSAWLEFPARSSIKPRVEIRALTVSSRALIKALPLR